MRADGPSDLASLKGRPIGVATTSSITAWMAREFARQQGWGANGVVLVATGGTDSSLAGLFAKNLDAAVLSTETGFQLQEAKRGRVVLIFGDVVSDFLTHLVYARNSVIADRPDALRHFLRGWYETIGFMRDHRDATVAFFAAKVGISPSLAAQTYDRQMATFTRDGHFPATSVDRILRATIELGQLAEMPANPAELYDERFLPTP